MSRSIRQIIGMIHQPTRTIRALLLGKPTALAIVCYCIFIVSLLIGQTSLHLSDWLTSPMALLQLLIFTLISSAIGMFVVTAVLHLTADMLGGGGRGISLLYLVMISLLPFWLYGPLTLLIDLTGPSSILPLIVWIVLGAWHTILILLSVKECYRFTFGKSLLTLILPAVFIGVLTGAAVMTAGSWLNPVFENTVRSQPLL